MVFCSYILYNNDNVSPWTSVVFCPCLTTVVFCPCTKGIVFYPCRKLLFPVLILKPFMFLSVNNNCSFCPHTTTVIVPPCAIRVVDWELWENLTGLVGQVRSAGRGFNAALLVARWRTYRLSGHWYTAHSHCQRVDTGCQRVDTGRQSVDTGCQGTDTQHTAHQG